MWKWLSFGKRIEKERQVARVAVHPSELAQPDRSSTKRDPWTEFDSVNGKIIFNARLNGKQVRGLLDTGAELSFIDQKCAKDIGARLGAGHTAGTALGVINAQATNQIRLELNGGISANISMISIDLSHVSSFLDRPVDFILGSDLFRKWAFEIDFTRSAFRLLPTGYRLPGFTYMPLKVVEGVPYVSIDLRGRKITALVDLGMNGDLNLSPAEWQKSGVTGGRMSDAVVGDGMGNWIVVGRCRLPEIDLGGHVERDLDVRLVEPSDQMAAADAEAMIGLGIIERYGMIFDLPARTLALRPRTQAPERGIDRSGLGLATEGAHSKIIHVSKGSPAAKLGLCRDEIITHVNERPAKEFNQRAWEAMLAGTEVRLTLAGGVIKTLTLNDYY